MPEDHRSVKRAPFEIKVKGNLGTYRQSGDVKIGPQDIVSALGAYFAMYDESNPACPSPVAAGGLTVEIRYPTRP